MDPNVWGPPMWNLLFDLSIKCSDEKYDDVVLLFRLMEHVLPCRDCRKSLVDFRKKIELRMTPEDPTSTVRWLWVVRDMVNQKLGHTSISLDKLQARHSALTMVSSESSILDVLTMISLAMKQSRASKIQQTIECVQRLTTVAYPCFQIVRSLAPVSGMSKEATTDMLYDARLRWCKQTGASHPTRAAWEAQFAHFDVAFGASTK